MADPNSNFVDRNEVLFRRCLNRPPEFVTPVDYITREPKMERAAVRLRDNENGISCHREKLLTACDQDVFEVSKKGTCYVFAFTANVVLSLDLDISWGVIPDPVEDEGDEEIGHAHSLVAPSKGFRYDKKVHKASLELVRSAIIASARVAYTPAA